MSRTFLPLSLVVLALTISVSAFAQSKYQDIRIFQPVQFNGTTLATGHYTMKYEISGATAKVQIMKGKKEVASATGHTTELPTKSHQTALAVDNSGTVPTVKEIHFARKTTAIVLDSGK